MSRSHKGVYAGNIATVRAVEDCIRATRKYTEGIHTIRHQHPIQGEDMPSRTLTKWYEVYPELELSWDMPAGQAFDWLFGDYTCIVVKFYYDYKDNRASFEVRGGDKAIKMLNNSISGFTTVVQRVKVNGQRSS